MKKTSTLVSRILGIVLIVLMIVLVIDVVWQVLARYLLKSPSSFTDELARFLLIWVGLLGAAYALGKKKHLAIDLFIKQMSASKQQKTAKLIDLLIILFASGVMVIGGIRLVWITLTLKQISAGLGLPLGILYLAVPISGLLMILFTLYPPESQDDTTPAEDQ